jgi:hypothetical protein
MKKHLGAVVLLLIIAGIFFHSLFYPQLKIFSFPDYGQSDLWQQTYPAKFFLAESLKNGELPLWNPYVGSGYPEFAKAEIGALYLPNLVFLSLLPFPLAINMLYVTTFLIASISMYILCIRWKLKPHSAAIAGIVFAYSTFFLTKFPHLSRIESASLLPLLVLFVDRLLEKPTAKRASIFAVVMAQQIYAGHFQMMFISGLVLGLYIAFQIWVKREFRSLFYVAFAGILVALLAAIQLLPSIEFIQSTARGAGFSPQQSLLYSFPWKNFATLLDPLIYGSPHNATYPLGNFFEGNIFWENSFFISIPGLVLLLIGLVQVRFKKKNLILFFGILLVGGILLMTGKYSPFYLVHSMKPFSFFRAPSKYIFIVIFSSSVLVAFGYECIAGLVQKRFRTILFVTCISLITFQLYSFHNEYMITDSPKNLLESTQDFPKDDKFRYVSYGSSLIWNKALVEKGWQDMAPFNNLKSALVPNINVFYGRYSFDAYRILLTRRTQTSLALSDKLYALKDQNEQYAQTFDNFMDMQSVNTLIEVKDSVTYTDRPHAVPRFHFADRTYDVKTVQDMLEVLATDAFSASHSAFVEKRLPVISGQSKVLLVEQSAQHIEVKVEVPDKSLFVMTDTYYPGWNAYVDSKKAEIFPVNIHQRGVVVPKGAKEIHFRYEPMPFLYGKYATLLGYVLISLLIGRSLLQEYRSVSASKK